MRELESHFRGQIVVVGVHSAKYTTEGRDIHLKHAVRRLHIDHPVVNDHEMRIWGEYAVRAWPTLMFIGPDGRVIGKHEGEFDPDAMRSAITQMIDEASRAGDLQPTPLDLVDEVASAGGALSYPAAVQVSQGRIFIADTGNNRIVITSLNGIVDRMIGSGVPAFRDGPADTAAFHAPHGLEIAENTVYVADTENHSVRAIELGSGEVKTVAGTGRIARSYGSGGKAVETELRSPWDLALVDDSLFISMAGNHQLWMHRIGSDEIRRYAGTGHEGKRDDRVPRAWLAQPSGIVSYRDGLLFADAETSSIRTSAATPAGKVVTLVGKDLFDWGDIDGDIDNALLQHATGVAVDPDTGMIYISDTYNNKIKRLDSTRGQISTLAGSGDATHADGPGTMAAFFEPHGLSVADGLLYVADTNNQAIRTIDLESERVSTIIPGPD